jgi:hypothetical protein
LSIIFDSGANITITSSPQDLMPSAQEFKEQRDFQELDTIRAELHCRLAKTAEDDPNIIVHTVKQEFREVFEPGGGGVAEQEGHTEGSQREGHWMGR